MYNWERLPFGLNVSTSFAQTVINEVLMKDKYINQNGQLLSKDSYGIMGYIDDILIYTLDDDPLFHKLVLFQVLETLDKHGLKINMDKLELFKKEICYLNVILSYMTIKPNPNYVDGLQRMKRPKTVGELRRYLGSINFCRNFIFGIADIERPLLQLLQKDHSFKWNQSCENSYIYMQNILSEIGFLRLPDQDKPFILFVDASKYSEAGLLMQLSNVNDIEALWFEKERLKYLNKYELIANDVKFVNKNIKVKQGLTSDTNLQLLPVGYYSKKNDVSEAAGATLLELRGLCRTLEHFKEFTKTSNITAYTDRKPILEMIRKGTPESGKYLRYINKIISFDSLTLKYIAGKRNDAADYMSRAFCRRTRQNKIHVQDNGDQLSFTTTSSLNEGENNTIDEEEEGNIEVEDVTSTDEKESIIDDESKKLQLFKQIHDLQGHTYAEASMDKLWKRWPYEKIKQEYRNYVNKCTICIERNSSQRKHQPTSYFRTSRPLQLIQMDCLGPMPLSEAGNKHVLIWIDINTRFIGGMAIPD
uniref:RNA-directed DNA polymerase n=1 Tax=Strongyloides stercoralis TaxID=6248 RepID=A0A0K0EA67_STRER